VIVVDDLVKSKCTFFRTEKLLGFANFAEGKQS